MICPKSNSSNSSFLAKMSHRTIPTIYPGKNECIGTTSFLIYIDGWTKASVIVMKVEAADEETSIAECSHSILPPFAALLHATGGVLTLPTGGESQELQVDKEPLAMVCGGEFLIDDPSINTPNQKCDILVEDDIAAAVNPLALQLLSGQMLSAGGVHNNLRIGAASLVVDSGNALWMTGGTGNQHESQSDSEFVAVVGMSKMGAFATNLAGPALPDREPLAHHCLTRVSRDVALVIGGSLEDGEHIYFDLYLCLT